MVVRILHVGVGGRGRHWLEYVRDHPDFESVGMVDAQPASLAEARRVRDLPAFASLAEAAAAVEADGALVASPSFLHAEHALGALDAGLGVMVEKAFTVEVRDARRVLARAGEVGKPVFVAENFRYVPAERTLRKLVREGFVGAVSNATFVDRRNMPAGSQVQWMAEMDYPQLQELAVHHFDSLRSFFGEARSIVARVWNPAHGGYRHGANTQALIEMEGGVHVQYLGSLTSHKFAWRLAIEGENGLLWSDRKRIWWRARGKKLFRPLRKVAVPKGDEAPYPKEGTTSLLDNFKRALEGAQVETRGEDNLHTIALMNAGRLSDRERRVVDVEELLAS